MLRTDSQTASLFGIRHPSGAYDHTFIIVSSKIVDVSGHSDERTGLLFTIPAGLRQHSHFRAPQDS